jgi:hypothetical protein
MSENAINYLRELLEEDPGLYLDELESALAWRWWYTCPSTI